MGRDVALVVFAVHVPLVAESCLHELERYCVARQPACSVSERKVLCPQDCVQAPGGSGEENVKINYVGADSLDLLDVPDCLFGKEYSTFTQPLVDVVEQRLTRIEEVLAAGTYIRHDLSHICALLSRALQ